MTSKPIAPQAQGSNYTTVFNLDFRPPHKPLPTGANTKLKCPSCGVWGRKGSTCGVCGTPIPGPHRIYTPPAPSHAAARARHARAQPERASEATAPWSTPKKTAEATCSGSSRSKASASTSGA